MNHNADDSPMLAPFIWNESHENKNTANTRYTPGQPSAMQHAREAAAGIAPSVDQMLHAIDQWLAFGQQMFDAGQQKGYFSSYGWAAVTLRHVRERLAATARREAEQPVPAGYWLAPWELTNVMVDAACWDCSTGSVRAAWADMRDAHLSTQGQPVQREPLSFSRLNEIARNAQIAYCLGKASSYDVAFARGVEAAHGITPPERTAGITQEPAK